MWFNFVYIKNSIDSIVSQNYNVPLFFLIIFKVVTFSVGIGIGTDFPRFYLNL